MNRLIILFASLVFYILSSYEIVFLYQYNFDYIINIYLLFKIIFNLASGFYYINLYSDIRYELLGFITFFNLFYSFFNIGFYLILNSEYSRILLLDSVLSINLYLLLLCANINETILDDKIKNYNKNEIRHV